MTTQQGSELFSAIVAALDRTWTRSSGISHQVAATLLTDLAAMVSAEIEGRRAAVSGAGNVATHAAQKFVELGGKVVTLSASVDTVTVEGIYVTRGGLVVRAGASGTGGVSVSERK